MCETSSPSQCTSIIVCSGLSKGTFERREWIVSGDGQVRIEMDVTAQNRGQACSVPFHTDSRLPREDLLCMKLR